MGFDFKVFEGLGGNWWALAKRGAFSATTLRDAIVEPGDVWFSHGRSADEALSKVRREVLN